MSLLNWIEKNPLEAAALGTAAYFTGGAALGAMGGAGAAGTAGAGAAGAGGMAASDAAFNAALANSGAAAAPASGGLLGTLGSVGQAAGAAGAVKGLLDTGPAPQAAPLQSNGGQPLTQLYSSLQQSGLQQQQDDAQRRQKQMDYVKRIGGYQ